jgi:ketosteroid isomerase-like protein
MDDAMDELTQRSDIRQVIDNWIIWRDSGDWDRFATVWHSDAVMCSTWRQSSAAEFIQGCRQGWNKGLNVLHTLGGTSIELKGDRAVTQTRMTIIQRAALDGRVVDVTCQGRFYDLFERRDDRWAIVLRQPIYERDRLDSVVPGVVVELDDTLLGKFPDGYRHLAYLQTKLGFVVRPDMPCTRGDVVEALYQRGRDWLEGRVLAPWI